MLSTLVCLLDPPSSAQNTKKRIEAEGQSCLLVAADLMKDSECKRVVDEHVKKFGR